jgi:hypothetical protein
MQQSSQDRIDEIRRHIEKLGITEQDIADAVRWAREDERNQTDSTQNPPAEPSINGREP